MAENMVKKLTVLWIVMVMLLSVFGLTACGDNKVNKIDIGGEIAADVPGLPCKTRITMDCDIFDRDNNVEITVGFGFSNSDIEWIPDDIPLILSIIAEGFTIMDKDNAVSMSSYEKTFTDYSDDIFVCTKKEKRYYPNYYEKFTIKLDTNIESSSGMIRARGAIILTEGQHIPENPQGFFVNIYYAFNSEKIAFSSKSINDAQKKL